MKKIIITNAHIVLPEKIIRGCVEIDKGRITYIGTETRDEQPDATINVAGKYLIPGFIDVHTNGIGGFDLTSGLYERSTGKFKIDQNSYVDGLEKALRAFIRTGATKTVLTSIAAPIPQITKVYKYTADFIKSSSSDLIKIVHGLYNEGSFIKQPAFCGAHNPDYFNQPSAPLFDEMQSAADGLIKIVNIAPEWDDPGVELMRYLGSQDVICAAGHTGATGVQYQIAMENGLQLAIHLFNGPTGSSFKGLNRGGALEAILREPDLYIELIVDGYHVDPAYIRDAMARKGYDHLVAVTDSMFAVNIPGLRKFKFMGIKGCVSENGEYMQVADQPDTLFGSTLTMDRAFVNVLNWLTRPMEGIWYEMHDPLPFEDALLNAVKMCSSNPARLLGVYDGSSDSEPGIGSIEPGKRADFILADIDGVEGAYRMHIDRVFVDGSCLYGRDG